MGRGLIRIVARDLVKDDCGCDTGFPESMGVEISRRFSMEGNFMMVSAVSVWPVRKYPNIPTSPSAAAIGSDVPEFVVPNLAASAPEAPARAWPSPQSVMCLLFARPVVPLCQHQLFHVSGRELRPIDGKRQLVELAGKPERDLIIVGHRRAGVGADVEVFVPLHD
jgi:hypothetical protein